LLGAAGCRSSAWDSAAHWPTGHIADYLAAAAVIAIGAWMLIAGGGEDEEEKGPDVA
jgi:hypothetical protein